jgi:transposase-like protein
MRKAKMIKARFCPKCKSTNVSPEIGFMIIFGAPQKWRCRKCRFDGHFFPEIHIKKTKRK